MPMLFHCHECNKPTASRFGICHNCIEKTTADEYNKDYFDESGTVPNWNKISIKKKKNKKRRIK